MKQNNSQTYEYYEKNVSKEEFAYRSSAKFAHEFVLNNSNSLLPCLYKMWPDAEQKEVEIFLNGANAAFAFMSAELILGNLDVTLIGKKGENATTKEKEPERLPETEGKD